MEDESWRRNRGGGIMEDESRPMHPGGGIMEEEQPGGDSLDVEYVIYLHTMERAINVRSPP